ncbi:archaellin/type IV pilin N-terminal domain-containing protein [Pyrobaculum calidifontis]|nr:archaellin/type IV pilin N-terminal domain-containing protein [Pyrobaculum calidifontis]
MKTKGLEPIVAAVLLIVVAVIGAVLVYLWFSGYVTRATSQAEQLSAAEQLKIEAVSKTGTTVSVNVRNVGEVPVKIASAYVLNATTLTMICGGSLTSPQQIDPGTIQTINVPGTCNLIAGARYIVKVVTARGTEAAATFISP